LDPGERITNCASTEYRALQAPRNPDSGQRVYGARGIADGDPANAGGTIETADARGSDVKSGASETRRA
jgi:hypothetical protein